MLQARNVPAAVVVKRFEVSESEGIGVRPPALLEELENVQRQSLLRDDGGERPQQSDDDQVSAHGRGNGSAPSVSRKRNAPTERFIPTCFAGSCSTSKESTRKTPQSSSGDQLILSDNVGVSRSWRTHGGVRAHAG